MTDGVQVRLPRRLLPVDKFAEAIDHEQDRFLSAVKRDEMLPLEHFLKENWRVAVIVGDPGLGKTVFLEQLATASEIAEAQVRLHLLKEGFDKELFSSSFNAISTQAKHWILLFDGFDELSSSQIVSFYSEVVDLIKRYPNVRVVISSRTTFAQRHEGLLAALSPRIFLLDRFSEDDILSYMRETRVKAHMIERANAWFHIQKGTHIISVPRYLSYVCEHLNDPNSERLEDLPRLHVVFQSVVSRALRQEVSTQDMVTNPWAAERVIAKLALVMEIAQVNTITHDELLTFFDTASSDLKTYFLTPKAFTELGERLLKFDGEKLSFLDREIQEFLASTEIGRLPEPLRAVFALCFDEHARILKPSWFNTLRFLFDKMPRLFADVALFLLSEANIKDRTFYTLDEGFWVTAPLFKSDELPKDVGQLLFARTIDYFRSTGFWLDYDAVFCLASIYSPELESYVTEWLGEVAKQKKNLRVELSNIARLIGELKSRHSRIIPEEDWKQWLLALTSDKQSDLVAVRTALWALRYFKDDTIIEKVNWLTEHNDQFIDEALVEVCETINPEHPVAIALLTKLVKGKVSGAFHALMAVRTSTVLAGIISQIAQDEELLGVVLDEISHHSPRREGALFRLFSSKIDDQLLIDPVRHLVAAMMLRVGQTHRFESEVYRLCQAFSLQNEQDVLVSAVNAVRGSSPNDVWHLSSGLAYFLSQENQERVVQAIKAEFPSRFDEYLFTLLQREVTQHSSWHESQQHRRGSTKVESEEVTLPSELLSRLREFPTSEDFRVVVELCRVLEQFARTGKILVSTEREEVSKFISDNIFNRFEPSIGTISLNKDVSHRSWSISSFLNIFGLGIQVFDHLGESKQTIRTKLLDYLPFASDDERKWIRGQIGDLTKVESDNLCRQFSVNEALRAVKIENLLEVTKQLHPGSVQEFFPIFAVDPLVGSYEKRQMISAMVDGGTDKVSLKKIKRSLAKDPSTVEHIDNLLIERFKCKEIARQRGKELISRAAAIPKRRGGTAFSPGALESEMWEKSFASPLLRVIDPSWSDIYFELLDAGFDLASKGEELMTYADYLWDLTFKFTENLIAHRSYQPFIDLEERVAGHFERDGANWVQGKLCKLRNAYSMNLGKPGSFITATLKYNSCLNALITPIENTMELAQIINDVLRNDVGTWLVGAGRKLVEGAYKADSKQREVSIQRVMRGPLLEALNHKRHVSYSFAVIREPQIDDDRRTDLLISYGFVGPCVIELKLSSHHDLKSRSIRRTKSFANLETYMKGYRSDSGTLVVLEDEKLNASKRKTIADTFAEIKGIRTVFLSLPEQISSSLKRRKRSLRKKTVPQSKRKAVRKTANGRRRV